MTTTTRRPTDFGPKEAAQMDISSEQRGRELRMLDGIAALLDVTSVAARQIGKPAVSPNLHDSVSKVTATARDMLEMVRAEMATVIRGDVR